MRNIFIVGSQFRRRVAPEIKRAALQLRLHRHPVGDWILLDAFTSPSGDGIGTMDEVLGGPCRSTLILDVFADQEG
ncbi:hypothetical protein [Streptomyces sp. NBC_01314]|uniref:hypothetical protein n=1 Tax=Streptomyces sp. NBC_01314 TaxID=2903821 RepID=UPI0030848D2D|nr:hypothetical protein OG622_33935 [Streptomyces sp. NBC_01314]